MDGLRQNIIGPGANGRTHDGRGAVRATIRPTPSRSPARPGPPRVPTSYPWNDSSVFAAVSLEPSRPFTVVSYLEKSGYRVARAPAPVVKCMYLPCPASRRSTR